MAYQWPGNVRELINLLEYAFVVCHEDLVSYHHLPASCRRSTANGPSPEGNRGRDGATGAAHARRSKKPGATGRRRRSLSG